jgi:hypothetical protein
VPASFFQDRLKIAWSQQNVQQDVGCIQEGPLQINSSATWDAHNHFHATWDRRLTEEIKAIRSVAPQVIVADTPYLPLSAGREAGIPAVCLANFTWNEILQALVDQDKPSQQTLLSRIERYYSAATLALRIAPGLRLSAIRSVIDIGPIAEPAQPQREAVRAYLAIPDSDLLVLIGFGGIPLASLPWEAMERMPGYRFIADKPIAQSPSKILSLSSLPFSFRTLLASVDIIMTKPGYGTVVEAVAAGVSVVYVRRFNFADEQPLVDFLTQYGRAQQISFEDFHAGRWQPAYEALQRQISPTKPPSCTGDVDAAAHLAQYF